MIFHESSSMLTDVAAAPCTQPELRSQPTRKRPSGIELTANHKRLRLEWAMQHCHWRSQWSRVVWSDGASVCLRGRDDRLRVWRQSDDEIPGNLALPVNQGGGRLLIWAAIWMNGRTELHVQRNNINSDGYVDVLREHVLPLSNRLGDPSTDWIYMDDNATCHRSSDCEEFSHQCLRNSVGHPNYAVASSFS